MAGKSRQVKSSKAKRRGYPAQLTRLVPDIAKKAWRSRGFLSHEILSRWSDITDPETARHSLPLKMVFPRGQRMNAALHILVTPAYAPLIQHCEPRIIERINGYFGYGAVSRLSIHQGPVQIPPLKSPVTISPPEPEAIETSRRLAKTVKDDKLRELLQRWGADILQRHQDR